ncbi:uncharacterized protein N7446_004479 [Penicillium canescens]|uniref:Uncharacterized protein n=1 Tax=Penicillium canescens TaxID=5083 RepID=A0AAD6I196_PENCN|nr:uncharacterized protein N7446_004479 [Penicillium canescens]KAJ6026918.1 hypothetical protein N7460_011735 [Penicillium canescens]KAJ6040201.1 hypothetical protein N7444_009106 [Penicillium canescens]KAJ6067442.1 hypothetical protein N7446_004479 [Penicillium canescens]
MPNPTLLNAAGYGSLLVAIKHAASGRQFQRLPQYQALPNIAYTCSTVGWYQGSGYLILTGISLFQLLEHEISFLTSSALALLNFQWARNPKSLEDPLNRAMAALVAIIAWASSAWYIGRGLKASGIVTAGAAIFQAWATLR